MQPHGVDAGRSHKAIHPRGQVLRTRPRPEAATALSTAAQEWLARTCRKAGVPVQVTDPAVIARVIVLLSHVSETRSDGHGR